MGMNSNIRKKEKGEKGLGNNATRFRCGVKRKKKMNGTKKIHR